MEIYTCYKRPDKAKFLEVVDHETITEQAGYIPPKIQIEQFLIAGKRLSDYRREMFDFGYGEKEDEEYVDPTRSVGFDMADASMLKKQVSARMKKREAMKKIEKEDEEKQMKMEELEKKE